jgi:hypothetical protein
LTYLIKTIVLIEIRQAITIPKTIDIADDDVPLLFSIDGDNNERGVQRTSIDNIFGGGLIVNIGGGGGNWEQCRHA